MNETINIRGQAYVISNCVTCGVVYAVPEVVWNEQYRIGGYHYCSNGHTQGWAKENSETEKLRRERDRLTQRLAEKDDEIRRQRELRENSDRSAAAIRGHITRLKNRIGHGVCPCCNRTFRNLQRHMESKHPDLAKDGEAA